MNIGPITILPWPLPQPDRNTGIVPPWLIPTPNPGNGGIVPPWLQRDLGYEATHVTQPASVGAYLVTR